MSLYAVGDIGLVWNGRAVQNLEVSGERPVGTPFVTPTVTVGPLPHMFWRWRWSQRWRPWSSTGYEPLPLLEQYAFGGRT
jgi:hypothetical protein